MNLKPDPRRVASGEYFVGPFLFRDRPKRTPLLHRLRQRYLRWRILSALTGRPRTWWRGLTWRFYTRTSRGLWHPDEAPPRRAVGGRFTTLNPGASVRSHRAPLVAEVVPDEWSATVIDTPAELRPDADMFVINLADGDHRFATLTGRLSRVGGSPVVKVFAIAGRVGRNGRYGPGKAVPGTFVARSEDVREGS